jgi:cytochrome P450
MYNWPYLGSLVQVTRHFRRFHDLINDVAQELGDGRSWSSGITGNPPFVYIGADPFLVEHVLKNAFWKYEKGPFFRQTMDVFLGQGIFNSDGSMWQKQRKVASHLFTARNLREDMSAVFLRNSKTLLAHVRRHAQEQRPFDIQDLYFRFTLDSFAEIAFGESVGCLSDGASLPFAQAFDLVQAHTSARFFFPGWELKRALNLGSERIITHQIRIMKDFGLRLIERRRRQRETDKSAKPDLLWRYIDFAETNQQPIDNTELLDVVLNMIIAGRDTTACLLSWATYELTQNPELQERLFAEVQHFRTEEESAHAVQELPLLHAFLLETLRLHPPVPQDTKQCVADDVWPAHASFDGGEKVPEYKIPAGTMIAWSPYLMGRSEKLWGKNADKFDLTKWFQADGVTPIKVNIAVRLRDSAALALAVSPRLTCYCSFPLTTCVFVFVQEPTQYVFPVFNAGLRLCLGKSVAILESTLLLSLLLQQFRFTRPASEAHKKITYAITVTLPIKDGLNVIATQRADGIQQQELQQSEQQQVTPLVAQAV